MKQKEIIIIILLFHFCATANAQLLKPANYCSVGIFYDQDYTLEQLGFPQLNEDRNYTMGLGLYYASSSLEKWAIYKPHNWLMSKILKQPVTELAASYNFMLANGSYTPDSLHANTPIYNDRPYASLNYFQANANYLNYKKHKMYTLSFSLGMLGTNISKEVQTFIHTHQNDGDTHDPRTPMGWQYQISNGGAPTFLLAYQEDFLLTQNPIKLREDSSSVRINRLGGEWKFAWKANVGWYNMISTEISYRIGWIDPRNWTYKTNPLGSSNSLYGDNDKYDILYKKPHKCEAYFFGTLRTNFIAYNVLLSGQGGIDAVTIPNNWARHGVLDGAFGVCISPVLFHRVNIDCKGKFNFRSPEFEAPGRNPRWHYWGGIELIVTMIHE